MISVLIVPSQGQSGNLEAGADGYALQVEVGVQVPTSKQEGRPELLAHVEVLSECRGDVERAVGFLPFAQREGMMVREIRKHIRRTLADNAGEPQPAEQVIYRDNEFFVVLDAFNDIARYLEGITSATSDGHRSYIKAELEKLNRRRREKEQRKRRSNTKSSGGK